MAFDAYKFTVPENKRFRVIVDTDCKNEADDQFALAHHLMTPKSVSYTHLTTYMYAPLRGTLTMRRPALKRSLPMMRLTARSRKKDGR